MDVGNYIFILILAFLSIYFSYWIIKTAVKNGIVEAQEILANKSSNDENANQNKE